MSAADVMAREGIRLWLLRLFGLVLLAIGAVLAIGGFKLVSLGGSPYYIIIGIVLFVSSLLTLLGRVLGYQLYVLAFLATLIWSLYESGLDGWALVPRLV